MNASQCNTSHLASISNSASSKLALVTIERVHMAVTTRRACALALAMAVVSMATTMALAQNSAQDFLDSHNAARWEVGVGQVGWDQTLANYAAWYANERRGDCALTHSDSQSYGYGENIFKGFGNWPWTGLDAVNYWVSEKAYYDYNSNTCSPDSPFGTCGHYTQVVWRDTNWIGCARVDCDNNLGVFITCNYYPQGNWEGQWPYLAVAARSAAA